MTDNLHEHCAVWGLYNKGGLDAATLSYMALFSMQHRGQDGSGLAATNGKKIISYKKTGLVNDVFYEETLKPFRKTRMIIGHNRYATSADSDVKENTQPLVMHGYDEFLALAHNGHLVNGKRLGKAMQKQGVLFHTLVDSEILMHLIAHESEGSLEDRIERMISMVKGSYALVIMDAKSIVGVRDPWGIRPLLLGKIGESYMLASESCAFTTVGGEIIRDVAPGEIITIDEKGVHSRFVERKGPGNMCVFEYVYFARADSTIQGVSVFQSRKRMGELLAEIAPVEADLVAGVPDSAMPAAMGYAERSGIPYGLALVKSPYAGRTFIMAGQSSRESAVRLKQIPVPVQVEGKRIVLVDDSIVRGTNSIQLINMLKQAGAKEVHMRIASPPVQYPCHFGINTPTPGNLISTHMDADGLCKYIGADSLVYLPQDKLDEAVPANDCGLCMACFDGNYPMKV